MVFFCIILVYSENGMTLKSSGLSMFSVLLSFVGLGIPNVPNRLPGRILVSWSIFLLWCHNVGCRGVVQQGGKSRGLLLAWGSFTVFKSNWNKKNTLSTSSLIRPSYTIRATIYIPRIWCQRIRAGTEGQIRKAEKIENWKAEKLTGRPNK